MTERPRSLRLPALVLVLTAACASGTPPALTDADHAALRAASRAYAEAWLANDPEAVMATFVAEPVLSPSGLAYLEGQQAARAFWWPPAAPASTVTRFDTEVLETGGSGTVGYVRGTFVLGFDYDGASYENRGKYLQLLGRGPGGTWRITHHLWDDLPAP